jgi:hypothetical protein
MAAGASEAMERRSRFWLYAPFATLLLVAVAWSIAWLVIRNRTSEAIDAWIAAEAQAGRHWACADKTLGGYPFRVELTCGSVRFTDGQVTASTGSLRSLAQIYQPRHLIAELQGPLRFNDGRTSVEGEWRLLDASLRGSRDGLERASVVITEPRLRIRGLTPQDMPLSSERFEAHVRPNPTRRESDGAYDAALVSRQARIPGLDQLAGGTEATDIQVDVTATQAEGLSGRTGIDEVERWREAGGKLEVVHFAMRKGPRRLEGKGQLQLDEERRLAGRISLAAAGLDELIGNLTGNRGGGGLLGALLGQSAQVGAAQGEASLKPLPPLSLAEGKVILGPFVVPRLRLEPLY